MEIMNIIASASILLCILLIVLVPISHLIMYAKFSDTDEKYLSDNYHISDNLYSKEFFNNIELSIPIIIYIIIIFVFMAVYTLQVSGTINLSDSSVNIINSTTIFNLFLISTVLLGIYFLIFYPILYEIYQIKKKIKDVIKDNISEDYLDEFTGKKLAEYNNESFIKEFIKAFKESANNNAETVKILYTHYLLIIIKDYENQKDSNYKIIIKNDMFEKINIINYIKLNKLYSNKFLRLGNIPINNILNSSSVNTNQDKKKFIEKIYYPYLRQNTILISDINKISKKYNKIYSPIIISFFVFVVIGIITYKYKDELPIIIKNFYSNLSEGLMDIIQFKKNKN